ncbi:MAG: DNA-deoxyinosine glycosylase [Clostridia bacterium]|nr:DNA-deoxyinosine glycosylase [Clostridia bacterium]
MAVEHVVNKLSKKYDNTWGNRIKTVIIGTIPGQESLCGDFYYLSKSNSFWKIMDEIIKPNPSFKDLLNKKQYNEILDILKDNGIALFDVLSECYMDGSLNKTITNEVKNDNLEKFLNDNPDVKVVFNGKDAKEFYDKLFRNEYVVYNSSNSCSKIIEDKIKGNVKTGISNWNIIL